MAYEKTVSLITKKLLSANEVFQRYARNLRAPTLNCAQDDRSKNGMVFCLKTRKSGFISSLMSSARKLRAPALTWVRDDQITKK